MAEGLRCLQGHATSVGPECNEGPNAVSPKGTERLQIDVVGREPQLIFYKMGMLRIVVN